MYDMNHWDISSSSSSLCVELRESHKEKLLENTQTIIFFNTENTKNTQWVSTTEHWKSKLRQMQTCY